MRLYLFPVTRQRTLIYCKRTKPLGLPAASATSSTTSSSPSPSSLTSTSASSPQDPASPPPKPPLLDRITERANKTWVSWESAPSGWKRSVTTRGNQLFARIPYTEWGLKSIPPLSSARAREETELSRIPRSATDARRRVAEVDVVYPARLFQKHEVREVLKRVAAENKGEYRRKLWWSVLVMPLTAPVALIPVIPNLPFFYLVFRAWSFWRAGAGCKRIEHLLEKDLLNERPSEVLQQLWDAGPVRKQVLDELEEKVGTLKRGKGKEGEEVLEPEDEEVERVALEVLNREQTHAQGQAQAQATADTSINGEGEERLLYSKGHGKVVGLTLNMPEVEVELERAHGQVAKALAKGKDEPPSPKEEMKEKR